VIEEMRLWRVARSPEQIRAGMEADDGRGPGGFDSPGVDPASEGLVAYWRCGSWRGWLPGAGAVGRCTRAGLCVANAQGSMRWHAAGSAARRHCRCLQCRLPCDVM
jgi:hypothetical protein